MNKLAILGGQPLIKKRYPPYITVDEEDKKELMKVIDSGILSGFAANPGKTFLGGKKVLELEMAWSKKFNVKYSVTLNSATSALHAALFAVGVGPGDEVILPPSTMSGCSAVILALNAIPVFADENPETLCIMPESIEKRITRKTKAIMPVHLTGNICEMDKILKIARRNKLKVIEDASQSPLGKFQGRLAGTIGDIGVYSLNCHKIIQTGEGGVAVTNNENLAIRMRLFRNHGEKYAHLMGRPQDALMAGLNLRMTELQAAVAKSQLRKLVRFTRHRIKLASYMTKLLKNIQGISPIKIYKECQNVYYIYHMKYEEEITVIPKKLFVDAVKAEGVPLYDDYCIPLYMQPVFQKHSAYGKSGCPFKCRHTRPNVKYKKGLCPGSESINKTSIWLDILRQPLTIKDVEDIYRVFLKIIENKRQLLTISRRRDDE